MRKIICLILFFGMLLVLTGEVISCKADNTETSVESTIRAYADPATETTLQGLSEGDLAKYTQCANAEFKAALTQEMFDATAAQINSQLGAYESKEFLSTEEQQGYTIVHYKAKYANAEVGIKMVFDKNHLVAGQWFE